jgi:hypothetical protein
MPRTITETGSKSCSAQVTHRLVLRANPGTARITVTIVTGDGQAFVGRAQQRVGQPN